MPRILLVGLVLEVAGLVVLAVLARRYDGSLAPFAVAVIAQALGWCFLVALVLLLGLWRRAGPGAAPADQNSSA